MVMKTKIDDKTQLSVKTKLFYGIGDIGNAANNSAFQFFLMKFFTDIVMVSPAVAASALLVAKIWDAFTDPIFGWISDRTRSRFGKRRIYLITGALPLAVSIALVWFIPVGLSNTAAFVWITLSFMFFGTMWTITNVPYYALSAELTNSYKERSSLTAFRMIMAVPAFILGAALTPAIADSFKDRLFGYHMIGIIYGALGAIVLWIAVLGIREYQSNEVSKGHEKPQLLKDILITFQNKPFVVLLIAFVISNIAFTFTKTFISYYLTYQLNMESQITPVMLTMLICVIISLFPWKMLSDKMNKGSAYALGLAIGAVAVFMSFFLPHQPTYLIYIIAAIAGIGFSATWIFPWSMVPDTVDYDTVRSGICRSGMYFGVWGLTTKLSEALTLAITGWALQFAGYVPNVEQTITSMNCIRLFFGPVPAILILISLPLLIWYPITRKSHEEMLKKLEPKLSKGLRDR
jgi:GPH family glycoside/pentoside/hexuronide:cation symporter